MTVGQCAHIGHKVGVSEGQAAHQPIVQASPVEVRSASHTDQSSGVVADERRREDSQPGGEWEVRRAHEESGRSREGTPPANRNSPDGRKGNNGFVVAGGRLWPPSAMLACLAVPAADRCPDTAFEEITLRFPQPDFRPAYNDVRGDIGCRTNARVDAVRPLNRHGLNSRTARDSGLPVVPLVFKTMYDVALPGLGGEKRVYAAGCRL